MKMTTVAITLIDPNPYRDFSIYPIVQEQVDALKSSYATRDFGIIAVRPVGNRYQQVYGHHRLEALKQMGITTVDVKIEAIDDDQMVKEMASENATQQGNSFPAQVDSVAAIARRLAYWLLISEDDAQWNELMGTPSATADGVKPNKHATTFYNAKEALLRGDGMGERLIRGYCPTLPKSAVEGAIGYLKQTGLMAGLVAKVKDEVEAEAEENSRAEQLRRERAEAARKEAEEAERKAVESAKAAAAAAAKANAARKEEAEARAAEQAKRAEAMKRMREEEAAKEAERRKVEAARQEAARKAAEDAAKAQREFAEKVQGMHPDCLTLLRGERHMRAWRPIVTANPKVFPVPNQPDMIREMYSTIGAAKGGEDKVTFEDVARWCNEQVGKANAEYQRMLEQNEKLRQSQSKSVKAHALIEELRAAMGRFNSAATAIDRACQSDAELATIIYGDMDFPMSDVVTAMERSVEALRTRFGVKSRRGDIKRVEKEVLPDYAEFKQIN